MNTKEVIAEIRLAPGEVGYYDDYSGIYLSTAHSTAKIYASTNTTQIRKSIRSGRLRLISGSLFGPAQAKKDQEPKPVEITPEIVKEESPVETITESVEAPVEEPAVVDPIPVEETLPEEISTEEVSTEEEKPKRRRSRKKADAE